MNSAATNKLKFYFAKILFRAQVDKNLTIEDFTRKISFVWSLKQHLEVIETHV